VQAAITKRAKQAQGSLPSDRVLANELVVMITHRVGIQTLPVFPTGSEMNLVGRGTEDHAAMHYQAECHEDTGGRTTC